ncbi:MAG: T9SS type A sorting domain-containing protein [Chitinophagales bacterium]
MMEVIDVSGRRLVSEQLPVNIKIQTIDVSAFAKGIYLVNIRYKNENSTISFLVE